MLYISASNVSHRPFCFPCYYISPDDNVVSAIISYVIITNVDCYGTFKQDCYSLVGDKDIGHQKMQILGYGVFDETDSQ